jgi:phage baseplate assembly protein W
VLTLLSASRVHLVNSYGYQRDRREVYGSNIVRLIMAPITGGIRTRLVPRGI